MSRVFGKTTSNANDIIADYISATDITSTEISTVDISTVTEEVTGVATENHLVTTGPLGIDITSSTFGNFGTMEVIMDPSTGYGIIQSDSTSNGISINASGPNKIIKLSTNGILRIGVQDSRTTVYGDLYVTGNIYNLPSIYSYFSPYLTSSSGSIGSISYTTRQGVYITLNGITFYSIALAGSYNSSSSSGIVINFSNLPNSAPPNNYISNAVITSLQNPSGGIIPFSSNTDLLYNYVTDTYIPLFGTGSFDILTSGFYLQTTGNSFTPTLSSGSSVFTFSTQNGSYTTYGGVFLYFITIVATYTGATGNTIDIENLPANTNISSVSTSVQSTGLIQPNILIQNASTNYSSLFNPSLNSYITLSGSGSLSIDVSGIIIPSGISTSFSPSIITFNGSWIDSSIVQTANYVIQGNIIFFTITYEAIVTSTSTDIRLSLNGLPLILSNCIVGDIYTTGLNLPLTLKSVPGSETFIFYNQATQSNLSVSIVNSTITFQVIGYYIAE